jgi:hypothetical protein
MTAFNTTLDELSDVIEKTIFNTTVDELSGVIEKTDLQQP